MCFVFYLFSAQFTVEVKHLSDLQSNHGSNMKNFHKLLRHCNVLYSSTSYAQSISKTYFASSIHYVYNFYYIYLHSVLLYQHYRNILFKRLILEKSIIFTRCEHNAFFYEHFLFNLKVKFRRNSSSDGITI